MGSIIVKKSNEMRVKKLMLFVVFAITLLSGVLTFFYYTTVYMGLNYNLKNDYYVGISEINKTVKTLEVNKNEPFKIMQVTDLHLKNGLIKPDRLGLENLKQTLLIEKPNLVVLGGDTVRGVLNYFTLKRLANLFEKTNTYFAYALGNHDGEDGLNNNGIFNLLKKYPHFIGLKSPSNVRGVSNYVIALTNNSESLITLGFLDSNPYDSNAKPILIQKSQVNWYADLLKNEFNNIPNILFTHIPIKEFELLYNSGNYKGKKLDSMVTEANQTSYLFEKIKEIGNTKAVFSGHHHLNTLMGEYEGVELVNGLWSGYASYFGNYHNDFKRGVTLIELNFNSNEMDIKDVIY